MTEKNGLERKLARRPAGLTLLLALLFGAGTAAAEEARSTTALDGEARQAMADKLAASLREVYVFGDKAEAMAAQVESRLAAGAYEAASPEDFAARLTGDLRGVAADKHLRVFVLPPEARKSEEDLAKARRRYEERAWRSNFGFRRIEILEGNVGYLELRKFADPAVGGATATAAMATLANVEALIIDLRQNQGGSPFMVQLLASYLLEEKPTHLVDQQVRSLGMTRQIHSLPWVQGKRLPDTPVFVLTSSSTFSAAEGFTYLLQSLERATIVGERTAGGAHPVKVVSLGHGIAAAIPFARAINPITGSNWEGTGVAPDVETPAGKALDAAYREALTALAESAEGERKAELEGLLRGNGTASP